MSEHLWQAGGARERGWRHLLDRLLPDFGDSADTAFFRDIALLGAAMFIVALGVYVATVHWTWPFPRDNATLIVGRDFLNLWMYGRAALEPDPGRFFDVGTYNRELHTLLGFDDYPGQNWPNGQVAGPLGG